MASKGTIKRFNTYRHNAFSGHVSMDQAHMVGIIRATTTTPSAKAIAQRIHDLLSDLRSELKTRIDQE